VQIVRAIPESTDPFGELKSYVGFTDDDTAVLRAFFPQVEPKVQWLVDRFYDAIERNPRAVLVLQDRAQIERLKGTLKRWLRELHQGPHDDAYYQKRLLIGRVHVKVGLPQEFVFTAMNLLRTDLHVIATDSVSASESHRVVAALARIMDIELAIMISTFMSAHEQRELEQFREIIVTHLPDSVFLLDGSLRVVAPSRAESHLVSSSEITGRLFTDVLSPELIEAARLSERVPRAAMLGDTIVLPRVQVDHDGERRWFKIRIIPVEHSLARVFLHIEDLTDAIESEARIQRQERLTHLGTMAASVAHEIRNPLAGISSTIQVISNTLAESDRRREPLDKVRQQVMRLGDLVGDLLSFARPIQVDLKISELAAIARQAAAQVAAGNHPLATITGTGRALVDQNLLSQALLNLIQNAWQAGAENVVVEVADGSVAVVDDGPGMSPETAARVFDAFFTTKTRGTGLGLPVARKTIEAMGGTITISESALGGAGFLIRLMPGHGGEGVSSTRNGSPAT
jgi:signal transduction histidine kinase